MTPSKKLLFATAFIPAMLLTACNSNSPKQVNSLNTQQAEYDHNVTNLTVKEIKPDSQNMTVHDTNSVRVVSSNIYTHNTGEVIRQGRYALFSIKPEDGQKNLLSQLVSLNLPKNKNIKVENGLKKLLGLS